MTARVLSVSGLATAALCGLVVGCGGSSSSSTSSTGSTAPTTTTTASVADKIAFCKDNAALDKATVDATTATEALAALKTNEATIDDFARVAPAEIKAQADVLAGDAKKAITANDPSVFSADAQFAKAGPLVDSYCGEQSNGTAAPTSTTNTSGASSTGSY
jgi:hypothetical protein